MCHGLSEERACTVSVPDLLRAVTYQEPDYDKYIVDVIDFPSVDGSGSDSLLPDSSDLPDGALADIVSDYSSAVKKFEFEDADDIEADDALVSAGSFSTWFDCIKDDDFCVAEDSVPTNSALLVAEVPKDTTEADKVAPKSRKSRKSAVKEQIHTQDDSEMDAEDPVLIDEKKRRRMSSNRASAQRSRQRKQGRLDELEVLTAQLRLENATLTRRAKIAEQLAKKFQTEKNAMAKEVEELKQELEAARRSRAQGSPDSGDESKDVDSGVCYMVEGGESSPDSNVELETSSKGHPKNGSVTSNAKIKRNIFNTDLSGGIFQELYDAIDSDDFNVSIGGEVPDLLEQEWLGSFTECLNA